MAATETHVVRLIIAFDLKNSVLRILANTWVGVCPVMDWSSVPPAWKKQQKMDIASLISQNASSMYFIFKNLKIFVGFHDRRC